MNYMKAAFGWLDEATAEDRVADDTVATLIELLAVSLRAVPAPPREDRGQRTQFPSKFDEWLYERIAAVALKLSTRQRADDLWQPVLALGVTGEYWVKYFLSFWFKSAQNTAVQPGEFAATWGKMLKFALDHPNWDLRGRHWRDGEDMVKELLGFDMGKAVFGDQARYALPVGSLLPEFDRAAGRWLTIPRVAVAFCYFALKPAGAELLLPSVRWLAGAEASWSLWSWEHDRIDEALVTLLREVLARHQDAVVVNADVRQAYSSLCNKLVARGGPAALDLRERFAAAGRGDIS